MVETHCTAENNLKLQLTHTCNNNLLLREVVKQKCAQESHTSD